MRAPRHCLDSRIRTLPPEKVTTPIWICIAEVVEFLVVCFIGDLSSLFLRQLRTSY